MTVIFPKMLRVLVVLCLTGASLAGPPVSRTRSEIEKFREFLESTRTEHGVVIGARAAGNPDISAWQNSGKYQGDILLDDEQLESMVEQFAAGKNAYIWPNTLWPARTIVYEFADGHFDAAQTNHILYSMQVLEQRTCIRFRPRNPGEFNYVLLTGNAEGCHAHAGYWATRGVHTLNLEPDTPGHNCFKIAVIIHEWLHIIGFFHMHSTHDRDNYVRINWENIEEDMKHNFDRYDTDFVSNLGLPYEYDSCMHYNPIGFSINGKPTMEALRPHIGVMGQQNYVTAYDFWRVDRHYGCTAWRTAQDYQPFKVDENGLELKEEEVKLQDEN